MKKRILQIILTFVGLILVTAGFLGIAYGITDDFYGLDIKDIVQGKIILDSNLRFASGNWFGIGIILFYIIPSVEKQKIILRSLSLIIFLGGMGRVISIIALGNPSLIFIIFTILELLFPTFILWQNALDHAEV